MAYNYYRSLGNAYGMKHTDGFNPYAAGQKHYGFSGRNDANKGPVTNKSGYEQRDIEARARRNALLNRLKAAQMGRYASKNYLGGK